MKTISILAAESAVMEAIADPRYLFTAANQFLQASGREPLFEVQLVGESREVNLLNGVFSVRADKLFHEVSKTDLIFIRGYENSS